MGVRSRVYLPLFRHQPGATLAHRCPAGIKLAVLITVTILIFSGNWYLLGGATIFVLAAAAVSRLRGESLLRLVRSIVFYGIFIAAVRILGKERSTWIHELSETGRYLWKLAVVLPPVWCFLKRPPGLRFTAFSPRSA